MKLEEWFPELLAATEVTSPVVDPSKVPSRDLFSDRSLALDSSRARSTIGWKPSHSKVEKKEIEGILKKWRSEPSVWPSAPPPVPKK